ncbi:unnamed protein product, partial [Didymodactylos carnosus]
SGLFSKSIKHHENHALSIDYAENEDVTNALHYLEEEIDEIRALISKNCSPALKLQLTISPPCYFKLAHDFASIALTYFEMGSKYLDGTLVYYETSRNIYLQLVQMKEIPSKDKTKMLTSDGYISENIRKKRSINLKWLGVEPSSQDDDYDSRKRPYTTVYMNDTAVYDDGYCSIRQNTTLFTTKYVDVYRGEGIRRRILSGMNATVYDGIRQNSASYTMS